MGELASVVRKNPELIGAAVVLVALLAWWQSRNQAGGTTDDGVNFSGGGSRSGTVDPGVVAIEQSRIEAGSANLSALASLVLGSQQSTDSLHAFQSQNDAQLEADLARTGANERTSLASTRAQSEVQLQQILSGIEIAQFETSARTEAARISAAGQAAVTAANLQAAGYARDVALDAQSRNQDTANFQTQASKDIARANANAGIVNGITNTIGDIFSALNPFNWF
jgi:hypothetical protein